MKTYASLLIFVFSFFPFFAQSQCTAPADEYGNQVWIVRAYSAKYLYNISEGNYKGYYTQKLDITSNYGVNTTLQWPSNNTGKPSQAAAFSDTTGVGTAYQGCTINNQDFSFVHKRRGFPPGKYEIFIDRWDDKTEVYLNNTLVVEMADYGNNTHAPKCIYLDETSNLEIRTDNRGGSMSELNMRIKLTDVDVSITPNPALICRSENAVLTATVQQTSVITGTTTTLTTDLTNINWSGGAILSGQGTATITVNPLVNTSYTYSAIYKNCTLSGTALVNVTQPPGDPNSFGNNSWNVHGYHAGTSTSNLNSLNYYGYYTQTLPGTLDYGFNTNDIAQGGWDVLTSPSHSSTWTGCNLPNNNSFTYVHKRKGFPCGTYRISMDRYDNNTVIYINGNLVHSFNTSCVANTCNEFQLPNTYQLDANSTIEVRTNEVGGESWARMYIRPVKTNILANNNDQKTCPVKGNEWVDFYSHPDGRYLASVRGTTPTSDLGNVTVTTFVDYLNQMSLACDNIDHITAVMQRHWLIDATINGQAEVRLPYKNSEFIALDSASIVSINPDDRVYYPEQSTIKLSKYDGPNENNNVNDNCSGNAMMYEAVNASFNASTYHYQDFLVPGFSEFWLHGSDYVTALPTVLKQFTADCQPDGTLLTTEVLIESKLDSLQIDFSENGSIWQSIYQIKMYGTPGSYQTFSFLYPNQREGYYRLSSIDKNGTKANEQIIHQKCINSLANVISFPNPANEQVVIQLNYPTSVKTEVNIQIIELSGKIVAAQHISLNGSNTTLPIDVSTYAKGAYFIHINDDLGNKWQLKQLITE